MALSIVQLGSKRKNKGLRIGTVRHPPRGVRKEDFSRLNYYDVWLPILSPSEPLVKIALRSGGEGKLWNEFRRKFIAEMKRPETAHVLELIAALSHRIDISVGCYCEIESHCHRSILRELLKERSARIKN